MKVITKKYQEIRNKTLLELRENILINRDSLPEDFIEVWQEFEDKNNKLQFREAEEWIKLKEFKIDSYFIKVLNILLIIGLVGGVLTNFMFLYAYHQYKTEVFEIINKLENYE